MLIYFNQFYDFISILKIFIYTEEDLQLVHSKHSY